MKNYRIGRVNVRLFWRGFDCPQRPYFSRRYTIASFGVGPFGVMLMEIWTRAEIDAFNARSLAQSPVLRKALEAPAHPPEVSV